MKNIILFCKKERVFTGLITPVPEKIHNIAGGISPLFGTMLPYRVKLSIPEKL